MNIVVLSLIIIFLAACIFGIFKCISLLIIGTTNSLNLLIYIVLLLITLLVSIYSVYVYLGIFEDPIYNGISREPVKAQSILDINIVPPKLDLKYLTDEEIYEKSVKRFN